MRLSTAVRKELAVRLERAPGTTKAPDYRGFLRSGRQDLNLRPPGPQPGRFWLYWDGFGGLERFPVAVSWPQLRSIWTPDWTPSRDADEVLRA